MLRASNRHDSTEFDRRQSAHRPFHRPLLVVLFPLSSHPTDPAPVSLSLSLFLSLSGPVFPEACFPVNNRGDSRAARGEQRNSIEFQHSRPRVSACSSRDRVNGRPRGCAESGRLSREFRPRRESTLSYTLLYLRKD